MYSWNGDYSNQFSQKTGSTQTEIFQMTNWSNCRKENGPLLYMSNFISFYSIKKYTTRIVTIDANPCKCCSPYVYILVIAQVKSKRKRHRRSWLNGAPRQLFYSDHKKKSGRHKESEKCPRRDAAKKAESCKRRKNIPHRISKEPMRRAHF